MKMKFIRDGREVVVTSCTPSDSEIDGFHFASNDSYDTEWLPIEFHVFAEKKCAGNSVPYGVANKESLLELFVKENGWDMKEFEKSNDSEGLIR